MTLVTLTLYLVTCKLFSRVLLVINSPGKVAECSQKGLNLNAQCKFCNKQTQTYGQTDQKQNAPILLIQDYKNLCSLVIENKAHGVSMLLMYLCLNAARSKRLEIFE